MYAKAVWILIVIIWIFSGCHPSVDHFTGKDLVWSNISQESIQANLEFLASDALEGRETASRGEELASLYLRSEMEKYGILPYFKASGYFQPIDLRIVRFAEDSKLDLLDKHNAILHSFICGQDFIGSTSYYPPLDTTTGVLFAGYGITAPEFNYDDYARFSAEKKIVVVYYGEPSSEDSSYFAGEKDTRYSYQGTKARNAREHGAVGIIFLSRMEKTIGWDKMRNYVQRGSMHLKEITEDDRRSPATVIFPSITVSENTMRLFFTCAHITFDSLQGVLLRHKPLPTFYFDGQVHVAWKFEDEQIVQGRNVVGFIAGTDPNLKNEYVGIGAHYDHLGIIQDTVYNGADDNASGTVAVLEAAEALARGQHNKRSILVILHTAEEKGLLGSKYLSRDQDIIDKMIAYINLDMVGGGSPDSLYCVGGDRISPELQEITEQVNDQTVRFKFNYRLNNPNDPERIYYRSDHYSYARKGIPIIFFTDYFMKDYHTPGDDVEKLNMNKIARVAELTYQLALKLANHKGRLKISTENH
jgi:hypothetical protein